MRHSHLFQGDVLTHLYRYFCRELPYVIEQWHMAGLVNRFVDVMKAIIVREMAGELQWQSLCHNVEHGTQKLALSILNSFSKYITLLTPLTKFSPLLYVFSQVHLLITLVFQALPMQALYQLTATGASQQNQQLPIGLGNSLLYQQLAAQQQIAAQQHQQQLAVSAGTFFSRKQLWNPFKISIEYLRKVGLCPKKVNWIECDLN